jgi:hypothetical protein
VCDLTFTKCNFQIFPKIKMVTDLEVVQIHCYYFRVANVIVHHFITFIKVI